MIPNPTTVLFLALCAPALCLTGIMLHAMRRTRVAKAFDAAALGLAIALPTCHFVMARVLVALGVTQPGSLELRRLAGAFLLTLLLSLPSLFLAGSALLISSSKSLSEPLR